MMKRTINKLIKRYGSQANLARALHIHPNSITKWKAEDKIPAIHAVHLEKLTNGEYKAVEMVKFKNS